MERKDLYQSVPLSLPCLAIDGGSILAVLVEREPLRGQPLSSSAPAGRS
jgi:hypothetical protein